MPTGKGLADALRRGVEIGCTAVQVFTSSPQQWAARPITDEMATEFRATADELNLTPFTVSHDSYLINLAAPDEEKREKSMRGLARELERCAHLGIPYVISHMGAHMGEGEEVGLAKVAEAARSILAEAPAGVTLLMETTAGQGSSLNYKFEHLEWLLNACNGHPQLGVCVDTCHIFAAGYDIRTEEGYATTMAELDQRIGAERVKVIHVNDSQKPFGKRVDRHAHLGQGEIGPVAFACLCQDARWTETPLIVETPEAETHHQVNVARLWAWSRGENPVMD